MRNQKFGFTIVELLVVVAILSILITLVSAGFKGVFYSGRYNKAMALKRTMQGAFDAYFTRTGKWPQAIQNAAENQHKPQEELSVDATDKAFQEVVKYAVELKKNPLFDYSALVTAPASTVQNGCRDVHSKKQTAQDDGIYANEAELTQNVRCVTPMELSTAIRRGASISSLAFGYVGPNHQHFCRFRLVYNAKTDKLTVLLQQTTENGFRDK